MSAEVLGDLDRPGWNSRRQSAWLIPAAWPDCGLRPHEGSTNHLYAAMAADPDRNAVVTNLKASRVTVSDKVSAGKRSR
jgi:hypothetical protein